MYLVYCSILSLLYGIIMIFPFVDNLDNDGKNIIIADVSWFKAVSWENTSNSHNKVIVQI